MWAGTLNLPRPHIVVWLDDQLKSDTWKRYFPTNVDQGIWLADKSKVIAYEMISGWLTGGNVFSPVNPQYK